MTGTPIGDEPPPHGARTAAVGAQGGAPGPGAAADPSRAPRRRRRGQGRGRGEELMVPDAEFSSYYGKPILNQVVWKWDIAAYYFLGGLAGGSSLLAAGADLTGAPRLRRVGRTASLLSLAGSTYFLINDLGRPERFYMMLRVARPTSPMSVGTWILAAFGPAAGVAALGGELVPVLARRSGGRLGRLSRGPLGFLAQRVLARPAGLGAAALAPALATYTAVLTSDTAVPAWHDVGTELPFVFAGSAAAASGGLGILAAPLAESGAARRLAVGGAVLELAADAVMQRRHPLSAEPHHAGRAGQYAKAAKALTAVGAAGAVLGRRSRLVSVLAGASLLAGSACTRFSVFHAGVQSAADPKYTVVPQRRRLAERGREAAPSGH